MNSIIHAYGPEDIGELRIAFHTDDDGIVFEYSDDGRGIEAAALVRIFDPFFTTRRNLGGSGLGLHIVCNLVTQRLGGTIRCDSAPARARADPYDDPPRHPELSAMAPVAGGS